MHSTTILALFSTALLPLSALACANYRAELTPDGDPNEPSISLLRVAWQDDCAIFCGTLGEYISSTSDNEWIVPCQTNEVIMVVKERGSIVEYRRQGSNGPNDTHEGDYNFSFRTASLTPTPQGGKYFAHNPYCTLNADGYLVAGSPEAWPASGWTIPDDAKDCLAAKLQRMMRT